MRKLLVISNLHTLFYTPVFSCPLSFSAVSSARKFQLIELTSFIHEEISSFVPYSTVILTPPCEERHDEKVHILCHSLSKSNHSINSLTAPHPPFFPLTKSAISFTWKTASHGQPIIPPANLIDLMHCKSLISSPI